MANRNADQSHQAVSLVLTITVEECTKRTLWSATRRVSFVALRNGRRTNGGGEASRRGWSRKDTRFDCMPQAWDALETRGRLCYTGYGSFILADPHTSYSSTFSTVACSG